MKTTQSLGTRPVHQTVAGGFNFKSGGKAIAVEFTDQRLSPHAGSATFWGWLHPSDWIKTLAAALPHPPSLSNNCLTALDKALAFTHGLLCDARKLTHIAYLRRDPLVPELLNILRVASQSTLSRFFAGFGSAAGNLRCFRPLWQWCVHRLPSRPEGYTVDLDSTRLLHEDSQQEGVAVGYTKRGLKPCLHPLLAVLAEARLMAQLWLRPGNTADVKTLLPVAARLQTRFGVRRVCLVADQGMISAPTIAALEAGVLDWDYILGARMRSNKEVREVVLANRSACREIHPERQRAKDPSPLKLKDVWVQERRYVVCLNEEQRRKDAADRQAILAHLRQQLQQGDKALVGNEGCRKYLQTEEGRHFVIDEAKAKEEARYDGQWVLRTNRSEPPEVIAGAYKQLWMVEEMFRTMKSILETRPIYHKLDQTIRGHVFCSFLALLLKRGLEQRREQQEADWEWSEILRGLDNLQEVEAVFQGKHFVLRSQVIGEAHKACLAAGVALPPTMREKE